MSQRNWRILVVEDDPDGQEVVATILEHLNLSIDAVDNVQDAEQLLFGESAVHNYNAAIIDLALPGKNGWELLAAILENPKTAEMPCIAVTAYHTSKLREEAIRAGFTAYFAKPIDATSFARRLEELLKP
jgi:CheY-like chemotaxis protein